MTFDSPTADEFPFVFDSWARSFKKSPWAGCIPNHLYDSVSRAAASEILDRGARVVVLTTPIEGQEGRRIIGYSVSEPGVLHFLFVKADYRGNGFGKKLLEETVRDWGTPAPYWKYTFRTRVSQPFLSALYPTLFTWDPVPARVKQGA